MPVTNPVGYRLRGGSGAVLTAGVLRTALLSAHIATSLSVVASVTHGTLILPAFRRWFVSDRHVTVLWFVLNRRRVIWSLNLKKNGFRDFRTMRYRKIRIREDSDTVSTTKQQSLLNKSTSKNW